MSYIRKDKMLLQMFEDIATREEKLKVDELYQKGCKGSAVVYQTKRILRQWNAMLGKSDTASSVTKVRTIRINEGGTTRLSVIS